MVLDKPAGASSAWLARRVQRALGSGRGGHAGTLDPAATGVLVVLLGEATKLSQWIVGHDKTYRATVTLGRATDTLDAEGQTTAEAPVPPQALQPARIREVLAAMVGEIDQVPPAYSAIKRDGRTLMSRARAGERVACEPRRVVCHELTLEAVLGTSLAIDVACGSGYYVRSLARDVGDALGVPAHLSALRRTRSGPFDVADSIAPEAVTEASVRPLADAVPGLKTVTVSEAEVAAVAHGQRIPAAGDDLRALL
ncbi:MAG: tRNA pseudouridine(55) synthase TruB, partial [Deltaproteobacteria bacterium]